MTRRILPYLLPLPFLLAAGCASSHAMAPLAGPTAGASPTGGEKRAAAIVTEADTSVSVPDPTKAAEDVRAAVALAHGRVTRDETFDAAGRAELTLRVRDETVEDLLDDIGALGTPITRRVRRTEVTAELVDLEVREKNLRAALERYREILANATTVEEMLKVEAELTRLRTELERIEATKAALADRVALATVEVVLARDLALAEFEPETAFYPGVRASHLLLSTAAGQSNHTGFGLSVSFGRHSHFSFDVGAPGAALDDPTTFVALLGTDLYSDHLGRGRRRYFNPYLGLALGYASLEGGNHFAGGATMGVELVKLPYLMVDAEVRVLGFAGETPGVGVMPAITVGSVF